MPSTSTKRRARIQPLFNYWVPMLGLSTWDITWNLVKEFEVSTFVSTESAARTYYGGPYRKAHIAFLRSAVDGSSPYELELLVVHELTHVLLYDYEQLKGELVGQVGEFAERLRSATESACDRIAMLLYRLRHGYKAGAYYED